MVTADADRLCSAWVNLGKQRVLPVGAQELGLAEVWEYYGDYIVPSITLGPSWSRDGTVSYLQLTDIAEHPEEHALWEMISCMGAEAEPLTLVP